MKYERKQNQKTNRKKVAPLAIRLTRAEVNSTCVLFAYQAKLPESASKLKKN